MSQALSLIKEALDSSLPLLQSEHKQGVVALWEAFLRECLSYIKQKSKETGSNLLGYVSFNRIWFR